MDVIQERYERGETCQEIATTLGCSPSTVWLRLKKLGVVLRPRGKEVILNMEEVSRLYQAGASCEAIGLRFGCDGKVVWRRLRQAGVPLRVSGGVKSDIDMDTLHDLYATGHSARGVADALGCTHGTVLRRLKGTPVPIRTAAEANREPYDVQAIQNAYTTGLTMGAIATRMGCSCTPIKERLLAAGVEIRKTHSYLRRDDVEIGVVVDLYSEGWPLDRVAEHLGCSVGLVVQRLDEAMMPRRSGSPHGGTLVHAGGVVRTDSGWEGRVYTLLKNTFGEALFFQGEFGPHAHKRTTTVTLDKPEAVRRLYLPLRPTYRWTPDFFIPALNLHIEVKGWHAREKWDSVIVPSILHSRQPDHVSVLYTDPYRMRTWSDLQRSLHHVR